MRHDRYFGYLLANALGYGPSQCRMSSSLFIALASRCSPFDRLLAMLMRRCGRDHFQGSFLVRHRQVLTSAHGTFAAEYLPYTDMHGFTSGSRLVET